MRSNKMHKCMVWYIKHIRNLSLNHCVPDLEARLRDIHLVPQWPTTEEVFCYWLSATYDACMPIESIPDVG